MTNFSALLQRAMAALDAGLEGEAAVDYLLTEEFRSPVSAHLQTFQAQLLLERELQQGQQQLPLQQFFLEDVGRTEQLTEEVLPGLRSLVRRFWGHFAGEVATEEGLQRVRQWLGGGPAAVVVKVESESDEEEGGGGGEEEEEKGPEDGEEGNGDEESGGGGGGGGGGDEEEGGENGRPSYLKHHCTMPLHGDPSVHHLRYHSGLRTFGCGYQMMMSGETAEGAVARAERCLFIARSVHEVKHHLKAVHRILAEKAAQPATLDLLALAPEEWAAEEAAQRERAASPELQKRFKERRREQQERQKAYRRKEVRQQLEASAQLRRQQQQQQQQQQQ